MLSANARTIAEQGFRLQGENYEIRQVLRVQDPYSAAGATAAVRLDAQALLIEWGVYGGGNSPVPPTTTTLTPAEVTALEDAMEELRARMVEKEEASQRADAEIDRLRMELARAQNDAEDLRKRLGAVSGMMGNVAVMLGVLGAKALLTMDPRE